MGIELDKKTFTYEVKEKKSMPVHLLKEEVVTIRVLAEKGQKKSEITKALGVTEGTARYHLRREAKREGDGRRFKSRKVDPV